MHYRKILPKNRSYYSEPASVIACNPKVDSNKQDSTGANRAVRSFNTALGSKYSVLRRNGNTLDEYWYLC